MALRKLKHKHFNFSQRHSKYEQNMKMHPIRGYRQIV